MEKGVYHISLKKKRFRATELSSQWLKPKRHLLYLTVSCFFFKYEYIVGEACSWWRVAGDMWLVLSGGFFAQKHDFAGVSG